MVSPVFNIVLWLLAGAALSRCPVLLVVNVQLVCFYSDDIGYFNDMPI